MNCTAIDVSWYWNSLNFQEIVQSDLYTNPKKYIQSEYLENNTYYQKTFLVYVSGAYWDDIKQNSNIWVGLVWALHPLKILEIDNSPQKSQIERKYLYSTIFGRVYLPN